MKSPKPSTLPLLYVADRHLDVGRTVAYQLAEASEDNDGELVPGIPAIRVGRQWRVPTSRVEAVLGVEIDQADVDAWEDDQRRQTAERKARRAAAA